MGRDKLKVSRGLVISVNDGKATISEAVYHRKLTQQRLPLTKPAKKKAKVTPMLIPRVIDSFGISKSSTRVKTHRTFPGRVPIPHRESESWADQRQRVLDSLKQRTPATQKRGEPLKKVTFAVTYRAGNGRLRNPVHVKSLSESGARLIFLRKHPKISATQIVSVEYVPRQPRTVKPWGYVYQAKLNTRFAAKNAHRYLGFDGTRMDRNQT